MNIILPMVTAAKLAIIKQNVPGGISQLVTLAQQMPHWMVPYSSLKFITHNDLSPTTGVGTDLIRMGTFPSFQGSYKIKQEI